MPPLQAGQPHAIVIGGSVAGLLVASLLRTIGWKATVFERTAGDLSGRGAGLGLHEDLFAILRRIGVALEGTGCVQVRSRLALDKTGEVLCEVPLKGSFSAWDRIYRALRGAFPSDCLRAGMQLAAFEQHAGGVTAEFADGSRISGDLLVGADGMRSTVRRLLMPEVKPRYSGYVVWRGIVDEDHAPASMHALIFNHMAFCFGEDEVAFSVPVASEGGTATSMRRCQFVWWQPVEYKFALPRLCTDASGTCHGRSIPPPLIRADLIAGLCSGARSRLSPHLALLVSQSAQPVLQPVFDLESPRLVFGRAVLVGDAAFVARPHVGMGVTKAALDAQSLADALAACGNALEPALTRYECEQRHVGTLLVARGRRLGSYIESARRPVGGLRTILQEWGAAGVIDGGSISSALSR